MIFDDLPVDSGIYTVYYIYKYTIIYIPSLYKPTLFWLWGLPVWTGK